VNTRFTLNMKIILLAMLLVPGAAPLAQQQSGETGSTEQQAGDAPDQQNTNDAAQGATDANVSDGVPDDLPDIDSQPIDSAQSPGPGTFIPSEQISQDFGVSFPVDI